MSCVVEDCSLLCLLALTALETLAVGELEAECRAGGGAGGTLCTQRGRPASLTSTHGSFRSELHLRASSPAVPPCLFTFGVSEMYHAALSRVFLRPLHVNTETDPDSRSSPRSSLNRSFRSSPLHARRAGDPRLLSPARAAHAPPPPVGLPGLPDVRNPTGPLLASMPRFSIHLPMKLRIASARDAASSSTRITLCEPPALYRVRIWGDVSAHWRHRPLRPSRAAPLARSLPGLVMPPHRVRPDDEPRP